MPCEFDTAGLQDEDILLIKQKAHDLNYQVGGKYI
jgi:hypothetical protein